MKKIIVSYWFMLLMSILGGFGFVFILLLIISGGKILSGTW